MDGDVVINLNTLVGIIVGGLVGMVGYMLRKWSGGMERKLDAMVETKVDSKLCAATHRSLCSKFDDFQDMLTEVRGDIKELSRAMNSIAKRGE